MMKPWGRLGVTSALEVYLVLSRAPSDPNERALWQNQVSIEPPVWGCAAAHDAARSIAERGYRVWSWDDRGVVFSEFEAWPPRTVAYLPWDGADPDRVAPTSRAVEPLHAIDNTIHPMV